MLRRLAERENPSTGVACVVGRGGRPGHQPAIRLAKKSRRTASEAPASEELLEETDELASKLAGEYHVDVEVGGVVHVSDVGG